VGKGSSVKDGEPSHVSVTSPTLFLEFRKPVATRQTARRGLRVSELVSEVARRGLRVSELVSEVARRGLRVSELVSEVARRGLRVSERVALVGD
jgi:hypothetical protein